MRHSTTLTKLRLLLLLLMVLLLSRMQLFEKPVSARTFQVKIEEELVVGIVGRIRVVGVVVYEAVGALKVLSGSDMVFLAFEVRACPALITVAVVLKMKSANPFGERNVDVVAVTLALARKAIAFTALESQRAIL